jgi:hypothetical protein
MSDQVDRLIAALWMCSACGAQTAGSSICVNCGAARPVKTLADSLLQEIARVRDQVIPAYLEIGPGGAFALFMMRRDLDTAARALAEQDAVACLQIFEELKGWHT